MDGSSIKNNFDLIKNKIASAALKSGRASESVKLVAVSKFQNIEKINSLLSLGHQEFGENYVQEWKSKADQIGEEKIKWHIIGPLQRNKIKDVVGRVALIESVDRLEVLAEIDKRAHQFNLIQDVLLEVHLGKEESKHGIEIHDIIAIAGKSIELKNIRLRGLMSLPPLSGEEATMRGYFSELRLLLEKTRQQLNLDSQVFCELSMGTSADFQWAIFEGATIVRVGTALFGERNRS